MGNIILYKGMARVGLFCSVGVVPLECLGNVTGVREWTEWYSVGHKVEKVKLKCSEYLVWWSVRVLPCILRTAHVYWIWWVKITLMWGKIFVTPPPPHPTPTNTHYNTPATVDLIIVPLLFMLYISCNISLPLVLYTFSICGPLENCDLSFVIGPLVECEYLSHEDFIQRQMSTSQHRIWHISSCFDILQDGRECY